METTSILKALSDAKIRLPAAVIDLDAFDANTATLAGYVGAGHAKGAAAPPMTIRIATKSLRVPELIRRALGEASGMGAFRGLMCYSGFEAEFLARQGFDDFLIAYPTLQASELKAILELRASGKNVSLVVDDVRQIEAIERVARSEGFAAGRSLPIIFEVDMALRLGPLVIGVRRSPLRTQEQIWNMIEASRKYKCVSFAGLMAYEAQVAGVGDKNPFKPLLSYLLRFVRRYSASRVAAQRESLLAFLKSKGVACSIFNGGGTGSLSFNRSESAVLTEVTAGSGFFCSHLFDYYTNFELKPAAYFALQVTRQSGDDWYACQGGGYVASGEPGLDRLPRPVSGALSGFEGTGEVQTPLRVGGGIELGSAVLFRPAKAGEWLERFNEVQLFSRGKIVGTAKTYRGFGECYY